MKPQKKRKSIQDILKTRQQISFVGREEQMKLFRRNLELRPEDYRYRFIFNVWGQGGVGKTTLLQQFGKIAEEVEIITALTDDDERSVPEAMGRLAEHFEKKGHKLGKFTERYKVYRQKQQELESDPEAPQGFSAFLGKTLAKSGLHFAKQVPVAGAAVDLLDGDAFASQTGEWAAFVAKKLTNKDEVQLVREPIEVLTPIFLEEISKLSDDFGIVLFFDTYERTDDFLDSWLLDVFEGRYGEVPISILFVIAGRQELDKNRWANYEGLIARLCLEAFTEEEAQQYLKRKNITNEQVIDVILRLSGRLPLLMATLAVETPDDPSQIGDPSDTAVERFLKWVDEPKRRQIAVDAAIPQYINQDILAELQGEETADTLFHWLKEMPFVNERHDGWAYHDVVRSQMLRYKRRSSLQGWAQFHGKLAQYYETLGNELKLESQKAWRDETWQSYQLKALYHRLCQAPQKNLSWGLNQFLAALKNIRQFAMSWGEAMVQAGKDAEVNEVQRWGEKLVGGLKAYEEHRYEVAAKMFTDLLNNANIEVKWRSVALHWRGNIYCLSKEYFRALDDLTEAINLAPEEVVYLADRGATYRLMERYEQAIKDFDRAIEIHPNYTWVLANRGYTYHLMERYEQAIKDFNHAIELDPNYKWVLVNRGATYLLMERYEQAIKDFNRAIELDPNDKWALANRGYTYHLMERYEQAIKDFNHAIELHPNYDWVLTQRGGSYLMLGCYNEALADLNRAIELDFDDWHLYIRALVYKALNKPDKAQTDLTHALELAKPRYEANPQDWRNTFNLALYYLTFDDISHAHQLYEWALSQDVPPERIRPAIRDLDDFLKFFPNHTQAEKMRELLRSQLR